MKNSTKKNHQILIDHWSKYAIKWAFDYVAIAPSSGGRQEVEITLKNPFVIFPPARWHSSWKIHPPHASVPLPPQPSQPGPAVFLQRPQSGPRRPRAQGPTRLLAERRQQWQLLQPERLHREQHLGETDAPGRKQNIASHQLLGLFHWERVELRDDCMTNDGRARG